MAGPAPKTRNWSARENAHEPSGLHVIVAGEVEVSATNKHPQLAEAPHVGKVLPLDLTISESGAGAPLVVWMQAYFHREVSANEFDRVEIRWHGTVIATVPVIDDTEQDALADKRTRAQNAVVKVKTKKPSVKKTATRVVAAVEEAVGGWAKGAKKALTKAFKKKPKKSAKKAAKKTVKAAKKTTKKAAKKASRPVRKLAKKVVKKVAKKVAPKKSKKAKKRR
jgi:hypothetical protein